MNPETIFEPFREWMRAKGMAESSIGTYLTGVNALNIFFKDTDHPKNISSRDLIGFLGSIKCPHTRKSVRCSVKLFYEAIIHQPHKFDNIPPVQVPEALPTILTPGEVYAMIDSKKDNRKHQTILQLIYSGGLRISEPVRTLQSHIWQDKDFISGNTITKYHITNSKGAKDRVIVIPNETNAMIEEYKKEYKPINYLFNGWKQEQQYTQESIGAIFKQAKKRCNITKDVTPHSLRHSRATHLLDAGLSLPYLKEFLGHKRVETTMIYLHCSVHGMARMINQADVLIDESVKSRANLPLSDQMLQLPTR